MINETFVEFLSLFLPLCKAPWCLPIVSRGWPRGRRPETWLFRSEKVQTLPISQSLTLGSRMGSHQKFRFRLRICSSAAVSGECIFRNSLKERRRRRSQQHFPSLRVWPNSSEETHYCYFPSTKKDLGTKKNLSSAVTGADDRSSPS